MPIGPGKFIQPTGKAFKMPMCTIGHWNLSSYCSTDTNSRSHILILQRLLSKRLSLYFMVPGTIFSGLERY